MPLQLNFSLIYDDERVEFVNNYLNNHKDKLSQSDLDKLTNYILWGKNRETGKTGAQSGLAPSRWSNADSGGTCASLDELLENPAFDQSSLSPWNAVHFCVKDEKFSRDEALHEAPESMVPALRDLWGRIDALDMELCQWELAHDKRATPPREWLAKKFCASDLDAIRAKVKSWSQATYLKKKRELVDLRTDQFVLRDSWRPLSAHSSSNGGAIAQEWRDTDLAEDLVVLPLGVTYAPPLATQPGAWALFGSLRELGKRCKTLEQEQLKWASDFWNGQKAKISGTMLAFDFRDEEQLVRLVEARKEADPCFEKLEKDSVRGWDVSDDQWAGRWSDTARDQKKCEKGIWENGEKGTGCSRRVASSGNGCSWGNSCCLSGGICRDRSDVDSAEALARYSDCVCDLDNLDCEKRQQVVSTGLRASEKFSELDESQIPLAALFDTLDFYAAEADLNEVQRQIFYFKEQRIGNEAIAATVNARFGKNYTVNYISTIFRQKIIPRIAAAAKRHEAIVSNIWFEEEFKTCVKCGQTLLRDEYYFTHQARSKDGFSPRCKICERRK